MSSKSETPSSGKSKKYFVPLCYFIKESRESSKDLEQHNAPIDYRKRSQKNFVVKNIREK